MRILLYYTDKNTYQGVEAQLVVAKHQVSLRWADSFKEAHRDECDQVYLMSDIDQKQIDRITKHYSETLHKEVFLAEAGVPQSEPEQAGDGGAEPAWTLETIETYITDLETELTEAKAVKVELEAEAHAESQVLAVQKAEAAKQAADEAKAKAEAEKAEADEAGAKAEAEKVEAEAADAEARKLADEAAKALAEVDTTGASDQAIAPPETPGLSIAQLRDELDILGVAYTQRNTKPELEKLLETALNSENGE